MVFLCAGQVLLAAGPPPPIPAWLKKHVGEGEDQIAGAVFERARALYFRKSAEGEIRNPCYFAMDATRPHALSDGRLGKRFYIICEAARSFRAIPAGHGGGRDLQGVVDFSNGKLCAKNFSNAIDSKLTAGGDYITGDTKTSFKGYYRSAAGQDRILERTFLTFHGEGETANARLREIGGHAALALKKVCLRKKPHSSYANGAGYVSYGELINYAGGRSDGCTSWSPGDAHSIIALVKNAPTTLYIYPEAADIEAVAKSGSARPSRDGTYWNTYCLDQIQSPQFWRREALEPLLAQYEKDHPSAPPQHPPICKEP
ncbi:hypothetical protein [Hyphomicrobium sp. ghe19]|uniref:hypothetical protein n=1 Tax=Hyphomicrobium sp. ghe19 TaxID=2682968 RepID=UPI0030CF73CB